MLPGPGSLTEPILLRVPLASPGPRHPAGPSALQPQRSTAARHSTPGPAPLLMHMQPYSGLYTLIHKPINNRHTHTNYNQRNYEKWVSTTTIHSEHNRPGPKHSLITIHAHSRSHMPVAAKDLQQFLVRFSVAIQKICCPLSATVGIAMLH